MLQVSLFFSGKFWKTTPFLRLLAFFCWSRPIIVTAPGQVMTCLSAHFGPRVSKGQGSPESADKVWFFWGAKHLIGVYWISLDLMDLILFKRGWFNCWVMQIQLFFEQLRNFAIYTAPDGMLQFPRENHSGGFLKCHLNEVSPWTTGSWCGWSSFEAWMIWIYLDDLGPAMDQLWL